MISRREFARQAAVATSSLVVGFDSTTRAWLAGEQQSDPAFNDVPHLDGTLRLDQQARAGIAVDGGNMFHRLPGAVLRPGSVKDVVAMVTYCNRRGIRIAMRGDGHSRYGQTQAEGGLVIDSRSLGAITMRGTQSVDAQPGAFWGGVVLMAWKQKLTPRVLPATCMALTIGGTLAVGGIGRTTHRYGAIVDNIEELDVVTGDGHLITCSPSINQELFDMVLAGQGQCGIIVRARIPLVPARPRVLLQTLTYTNLDDFLADQLRLMKSGQIDSLFGDATRSPGGDWSYAVEIGVFFDGPAPPDPSSSVGGLKFVKPSPPTTMDYTDFLFRFEAGAAARSSNRPSPYIAVWMPASAAKAFVEAIAAIPADSLGFRQTAEGQSFALHAMDTSRFTRPLFKVPEEANAFAFWIHRSAPLGDAEALTALMNSQRQLLAQMTAAGGKRYAPYSMVMSSAEWAEHFGSRAWKRLSAAKKRYDPKHVLAPEPAMFDRGQAPGGAR